MRRKGKVLVTGGAGFIGSHVVDRLIEEGWEVNVVDNLSTGRRENLNPRAKFHRADISNREEMNRIFSQVRPVFVNHHAAQIDVRESVRDPSLDAAVNILGSVNVIELSVRHRVRKIIYSSTGGAIYGEPEELPADEDCPVKPLSPYGVSKHAVEHYLELFYVLRGLRYTILRYPNVYGPRQDPRGEAGVVAIFTERMLAGKPPIIYGTGEQTRDYLYVGDVVDANILVMAKGDGRIYNLGTGKQIAVNDVYAALREALGKGRKPQFRQRRPGEVEHIALESSRARRELGWKPAHSFGEGIRRTVLYYQKEEKNS